MVKIGLVTDLHYAEAPSMASRYYRESLPKAREAAEGFRRAGVDAVVCLGDLIDNAPKGKIDLELQFVQMMHAVLGSAGAERHYVLGNHCVQQLSKGQFLGAVEQKKSYYSFDKGGVHFVVLDGCFRTDGVDYNAGNFNYVDANIPAPQLAWLEKDLAQTRKKTVVFCHQRVDEPSQPKWMLKDRVQVRKILKSSGKVVGVFMGHAHENDLQTIDGIRYACLQAMVEGSGLENGAYSILTVADNGALSLDGFRQHRSHPLAKGR